MLDGFLFEDQTDIFRSCSSVLNGEMLVFGGEIGFGFERQWSSVGPCSLRSEGKLDFDFDRGACNTIQAKFFRAHTSFLEHMNYMLTIQQITSLRNGKFMKSIIARPVF